MPLESSFRHSDYRSFELMVTLSTWIMWGVALYLGVAFWPEWWAIGTASGLFFLGGELAKRTPRLVYWWVLRSLPAALRGRPGVDILLFDAEDLATIEKVKLVAEDVGIIRAEGGCYRISLLRADYVVPFAQLQAEPLVRKDKVVAMRLRFRPDGHGEWVEIAATIKYPGQEIEVNTDRELRYAWGRDVLEGMKARVG